MKKKFLIIGACLIIILAGLAFLKKQQSPEEIEVRNAPIGYIGCSNTRQTVFGYHWVGGEDFWSGSEDRLHDYDSGAVLNWAQDTQRNKGAGGGFWDIFDEDLERNPNTSIVWWQLCLPKDQAIITYNDALPILESIRKRIPGVTIYVSPLADYTENVCEITGVEGIKRSQSLAQELDTQNEDVLPGPILGPMTLANLAQQEDRCHPNEQGAKELGKQMREFFDPIVLK